ncbi:Alcohol acetyltransferase [Diatrype stigma]|uniref:Alcohol acetyltransferase n=1 Tax=Diatrype stigma TaxID=117547 RepID=A0AAN9YX04_9PEZI
MHPAKRTKLIHTVNAAISDNVLKHPVLQVGIGNADTKRPVFVQLDGLDLRLHIDWRFVEASTNFEATLQELTTLQLDATYPNLEKQPGWRIVVLHQHGADFLEILFTWNHPHADGMSGKLFHQSLIESLNVSTMDGQPQDLDTYTLKLPNSPTKLPPPIEDIMELPLGMKYLCKALLDDNKPRVLLSRDPTLAHWAPITPSPYKTRFRSFTVENETLSKVLTACGQHQTTLTGLVHGLILASLASHLGEKTASGFQAATTINARRFVPRAPPGYPWLEPERTMGNFVTQLHHTFNPELVARVRSHISPAPQTEEVMLSRELADLIWDTAARVRAEIVDKLELGVKNDVLGTLKFVDDWRSQLRNAARKPRQASWMVTGLGILGDGDSPPAHDYDALNDGEERHKDVWSLRRAQFALSAEVPAAALMISPVTAAGGRLCVGGSWQDSVVDAALGERVMTDLERWLGDIGVRQLA